MVTHLSNEHSEDEDAKQPVECHEHIFDLDRRYGVITNGRRSFGRQVHAVKITKHNTTDNYGESQRLLSQHHE